jgi:outer membrane protein OmpA-like peptidoglycan-associated protein
MKVIKITLMLSFIALSFNPIYSQSRTIEKGNKLFKNYAYDNAIKVYSRAIENEEEGLDLFANLADSYYQNADMENAAKWYEELMNFDLPSVKGEYYFRYSQALKALGEYTKSDLWLERLSTLNADDSRSNSLKFDPNYLERIESQSNRFSIHPVSINTEYSDFASGFGDRGVVFASSRDEGVSTKRTHTWTGLPFLELFSAEITDDGNLKSAMKVEGDFNRKYNESSVAISNDGQTMFFTRNSYDDGYQKDEKGIVRLKLYRATRVGEVWKDITELPFNNREYSVAHPALSPDNKKLYFASDMPGTYGLSDIYVVDINDDGTYSEPRNLGNKLNTEGRDTFPFISKNGDLYFASDGHLGLGGLDVFVCLDPNNASGDNIFNVGKPINGNKDDFGFIINDDTSLGYFTSNRPGGRGSDDIYQLQQLKPLNLSCETLVSGVVVNKNTGDILPEATVVIYNEKSQTIKELMSDSEGRFAYELDCGEKEFTIIGSKISFVQDTEKFQVDSNTAELKLVLELIPEEEKIKIGKDLSKALYLNPIYFDFDKSFIRADARVELEKVYAYMTQNPNVKVDVRSHTDSRAPDDYNVALSDRRNKSTIKYLIDRGISPSRLTGRGYGETEIQNQCTNGVKCSNQEHEFNRRSEFIVISN